MRQIDELVKLSIFIKLASCFRRRVRRFQIRWHTWRSYSLRRG